MESIKFDRPSEYLSLLLKVLLLSVTLCIIASRLADVSMANGNFLIPFILTFSLIVLRQFYYKHYVYWNKRGVKICVNEIWGTNFLFNSIEKVVFAEDEYTIITKGGREKSINLDGIDADSKSELLNILRQNVR